MLMCIFLSSQYGNIKPITLTLKVLQTLLYLLIAILIELCIQLAVMITVITPSNSHTIEMGGYNIRLL